jgi:hypothetical protein
MEATEENLEYDKQYKKMFKDERIEELITKEEIEQNEKETLKKSEHIIKI